MEETRSGANFFEELSVCLKREGFATGEERDGNLPVMWHSKELCLITDEGGIRYNPKVEREAGGRKALEKVMETVKTTGEYIRLLEKAPALDAVGLDESYRKLAEFNGAVLAACRYPDGEGWQFVTWNRDCDGRGMCQGHYMGSEYGSAKRDFAIRSGLVERNRVFTHGQMAEIYRCVSDMMDMEFPVTEERAKVMDDILDQIRYAVPDLDERITQARNMEGEIADRGFDTQTM